MKDLRKFYIGGEWVIPLSDSEMDVINPANETKIATIGLGSVEDVNRAVAAAKAAFDDYGRTPKAERLALLKRLGKIYRSRYEEMAQAMTAEMGAPISMSREAQADCGIGHLEGFIDALESQQSREVLPNGDTLVREPIGVCGLITPWNWPMNQVALKVLPALAAGCSCVLKPSEFTPISAALYAEMIHDAGFPPGVFNLVNGDGLTAGATLSRHPDVRMISFTGSTRAGRAISKDAADTVKRVTLELGGKSPNLVFADCGEDLEQRVTDSVLECFYNTGQSCDAPTRMLVERACYGQVLEIAERVGRAQAVGDPSEEGDHIGPLVSAIQFGRVQGHIEAAIEDGVRVLCGGPGKPEGFETGYFVRPTIFADVRNDQRIAQEEVFGPVLVIIPFDTEDEAVELANDTPYGLAAYLQTGDSERAERVASRLRAGAVHINGGGFEYGSPFGGYKQSGNGREGGIMGLEDYQEVKTLHFG
ncbi:MAG: aldehyde dehydrogenase family protein [Gammaproteobacteria bacterium]|nr:aldehyde dehydrogenase family protein [Gammaproteobacteria bacterium]